ncbi:MAG TPA: enoyl-CoA hydratase-related protein, partial [Micavibrio sp.]
MNDAVVLLNVADGVATITLNRPDTHNAFDEHVIAALTGKLDVLHLDKSVRVLVLRGAGKSFSAGADLNWMKRAAGFTEDQNKADALALAGMLNKLYTLPLLTIACVQGAAMGGGLGLVSCCDIVIADQDALFALSEVKLGLIPATIAPYVLRAMGERQARRYFQTGERFKGKTAHTMGFVHEVVSGTEAMDARLIEILKSVASNGPNAMKDAKKLCLDLAGQDITPALMDDTAARIART